MAVVVAARHHLDVNRCAPGSKDPAGWPFGEPLVATRRPCAPGAAPVPLPRYDPRARGGSWGERMHDTFVAQLRGIVGVEGWVARDAIADRSRGPWDAE